MHIDRPSVAAAYGKLPLSFEQNTGQADSRVKFFSRGQGYGLFLTASEAVLALHGAPCPKDSPASNVTRHHGQHESPCVSREAAVRLQMSGANRNPMITGVAPLAGKSNYFFGSDPAKWHTNVPNFAEVKYESVYPGIDLVYYGNQRQLEFDLVVAPGADPGQVRFKLAGAKKIALDSDGDLVLRAGGGEVRLHKPVVYQTSANGKDTIDGHYVLVGQNEVAFEVGSYDKSKTLVVDPTLVYSTYLGGSTAEQVDGMAVDTSGNMYAVGYTRSSDFPTSNPLQSAIAGTINVFITKINASGTALVYSTYLGGSGVDYGNAIAVDSSGNAYIAGSTNSANFPLQNAFQTNFSGSGAITIQGFVTELNAAGSALVFSTYLGGTVSGPLPNVGGAGNVLDGCNSIALDKSGNIYVTGSTNANDFPTKNPIFTAPSGGFQSDAANDGFVTEFAGGGASLIYSTYLGANTSVTGNAAGNAIAVDPNGNAYVVGYGTIPYVNALYGASNPVPGGFVAEIKTGGSGYAFSTSFEWGQAVALDSSNNVYVAGWESDSSNGFPLKNPLPNEKSGAFVSEFNSNGSSLLFSTPLGGSTASFGGASTTSANALAVNTSGNILVTGGTNAPDFPTANPIANTNKATGGAFVVEINPSTGSLLFSTVLGGSVPPAGGSIYCGYNGGYHLGSVNGIGVSTCEAAGYGLALDGAGNVYLSGVVTSYDFPTVSPFQSTNKGTANINQYTGFVSKISYETVGPSITLSPSSLTFPSEVVGVASSAQDVTLTNNGNASLNVTGISITGTNASDFGETNTCGSSVAAGANCTISVTFKPTAAGSRTASVSFADNVTGSPQAIALTGTGAAAAPVVSLAPPTGLTFASQTVGTASSAQNITLTNTGSASLSITAISITGTNSSDYSQTNTCTTVAPSAFCTISVTFKPTATGTRTASVSIADNATGSPQAVALTGTGATAAAPAVTLSPTSLTFASETIGSSSTPQIITLTNSGTAALSVTGISIAGTNSGDYSETNTCGANVAASANCTISVTFKPTAAGTRTASVSIGDNAAGSPQTVPLTGTGAGPAPDFSIAASPASVTVTAGSSGPSTLTVTPSNGFNQAVSFGCSGLPLLATCTFSPATVTPNGSAVTTTVTIATTASTTAGLNQMPAKGVPGSHMTMALAGLVACLFTLGGIKRQRYRWLSVLLILAGLGMLSGCGGSSKKTTQGTPPGTYTVSVTATSGTGNSALSHNATVSLTVQ